MTYGEFLKDYSKLHSVLNDCFDGEQSTRIEKNPYVFVKLGAHKVLFANLDTIINSTPEIIVIGG